MNWNRTEGLTRETYNRGTKSRIMRVAGHIARMGEKRNKCRIV
jgi:hypothetical protein